MEYVFIFSISENMIVTLRCGGGSGAALAPRSGRGLQVPATRLFLFYYLFLPQQYISMAGDDNCIPKFYQNIEVGCVVVLLLMLAYNIYLAYQSGKLSDSAKFSSVAANVATSSPAAAASSFVPTVVKPS
jgi:hypothetical protein